MFGGYERTLFGPLDRATDRGHTDVMGRSRYTHERTGVVDRAL